MPSKANDESIDVPFVPQPTAGCGFIVPEAFLADSFYSLESEEFQKAHVLSCEFCRNKIVNFVFSVNN